MRRATFISTMLATAAMLSLIGPAGAQDAPPPAAADAPPTDEQWQGALKTVRDVATDAGCPPEQRSAAIYAYVKMQMAYDKGSAAEAMKACQEVFRNPHDPPVAEAAMRAACLVQRGTDGNLGRCLDLVTAWRAGGAGPASVAGANIVHNDLARVRTQLMQTAARNPLPNPSAPAMPHWGRGGTNGPPVLGYNPPMPQTPPHVPAAGEKGPRALAITLPVAPPAPYLAPDAKLGYGRALALTLPEYLAPPQIVPDAKTGELPALRGVSFPTFAPPQWCARVQFPLLKE